MTLRAFTTAGYRGCTTPQEPTASWAVQELSHQSNQERDGISTRATQNDEKRRQGFTNWNHARPVARGFVFVGDLKLASQHVVEIRGGEIPLNETAIAILI
jgi:hypothetical protein